MPLGTASVRSLFLFPLLIFLFGMQVSFFHHRDPSAPSASLPLPWHAFPLTAIFFAASATTGARALPAPDPGLSRP